MKLGSAAAGEILRGAHERGTLTIGVCNILDVPSPLPSWIWSCACGMHRGWVGGVDTAVLVVAAFLNRHSICALEPNDWGPDETSPGAPLRVSLALSAVAKAE